MQTISSFFIIIITIIIVVVTIINTPSYHTVTLLSSYYARFFLHYLVRHEIHNKIMHPPLGFAVFFVAVFLLQKRSTNPNGSIRNSANSAKNNTIPLETPVQEFLVQLKEA